MRYYYDFLQSLFIKKKMKKQRHVANDLVIEGPIEANVIIISINPGTLQSMSSRTTNLSFIQRCIH